MGDKDTSNERRVLESLGYDNQTMLLVARAKFGDNIDVIERLFEDGNDEKKEPTIPALHEDALFYQGGLINNDGLDKEDVYVELGDEPPKMVEKDLQNRINEAKENGLSN